MTDWSDPEILVAYVDGQMNEREIRAVEKVLESDSDARETVRRLREDAALLRGAFNGPIADPLPGGVVAAINAAGRGDKVTALRPRDRAGGFGPHGWKYAVAASLAAFAIGVSSSYFIADRRVESELARLGAAEAAIRDAREEATFEALERRVSGETVNWENPDGDAHGSVTPVRTFRVEDGSWCREYLTRETVEEVSEARRSIACREPQGLWETRIMMVEDS